MIFRQSSHSTGVNSKLRLFIILSSCLLSVMSIPYFALDMRNPKKCLIVDYPGSMIVLNYEVFDPNKDRLAAGVRLPETSLSQSQVQLEIFPPDGSAIERTKENHIMKTLREPEGKMQYYTIGRGIVHICAEIKELPGRKYPRPTLFGLHITEARRDRDEIDPYDVAVDTSQEKRKIEEHNKGQEAAKRHLSEMERLLMHMIRETNSLLKNADQIKDDEVSFHQKSMDMNSASRWWPILHVIVLLVTGFTQANHVIKFFK